MISTSVVTLRVAGKHHHNLQKCISHSMNIIKEKSRYRCYTTTSLRVSVMGRPEGQLIYPSHREIRIRSNIRSVHWFVRIIIRLLGTALYIQRYDKSFEIKQWIRINPNSPQQSSLPPSRRTANLPGSFCPNDLRIITGSTQNQPFSSALNSVPRQRSDA